MIQEELRHLVSQSVTLLGNAFKVVHGESLFNEIEFLRLKMKAVRGKDPKVVEKSLNEVYSQLQDNDSEELRLKAKAFSLMLELINSCEAAFRSYKLSHFQITEKEKPESIIYVFTSHPTESRSQAYLKLMGMVEQLLIEGLSSNFEAVRERLFSLMKIATKISLSNNRRPKVHDEMDQIFHFVLSPVILNEQISLNKKNLNLSFRTWVGGDKDGHPGVGNATMLESWTRSRAKLIEFIKIRLIEFESELALVEPDKKLLQKLRTFKTALTPLKKIRASDGVKVVRFKKNLEELIKVATSSGLDSPLLTDLKILVWFYPALVLPLEIREDSELIKESLKNPNLMIRKMLRTLSSVSKGMDAKWYVRGFVISMCQLAEDMEAAITITKRELGSLSIPVIPLFENEKGLINGVDILNDTFKKIPLQAEHKKRWGTRFEVMVGYSDSSKENGVLPARLLIEKALFNLEEFLVKKGLKPVFFHGSGGSTSRGGGTVQEQISWWPQTALNIFKVTIQGEMVQRDFHNPLIMRSQVGKILKGYDECTPVKNKTFIGIDEFAAEIQNAYRTLVNDPSFQELTTKATPYDYLNLLRIGSRPAKRNKKGTFSLRAIPWILCWTQTRLLLPIWWGTGSAWAKLSWLEKGKVKKFYKNSPLMQSYIKNLGFTLAKVELGVWNFHLDQADLPKDFKDEWRKTITDELNASIKFFKEISGEKNYTWFRPWLGESIYLRSSMIHPLNVIQKIALERKDNILLRETVTGIACGMLTTG